MPEQTNAVFVSYRREVSQYLAQALWQNLTARGIDVFYDLETLHAGQFKSIIIAQIAARPYMVPVLQPGALNRCVEKDDWFRLEIEAALDRDRMLVPVFTPDFDFEDIDRYLPKETALALRDFNMLEIPPKYFKQAIQELAENYLTPISRNLTPLAPEAREAAANQASAIHELPIVTTETLEKAQSGIVDEERRSAAEAARQRHLDTDGRRAAAEGEISLAREAMSEGDLPDAKRRLEAVLLALPDHIEALALQEEVGRLRASELLDQAAAASEGQRWEDVLTLIDEARTLDPDLESDRGLAAEAYLNMARRPQEGADATPTVVDAPVAAPTRADEGTLGGPIPPEPTEKENPPRRSPKRISMAAVGALAMLAIIMVLIARETEISTTVEGTDSWIDTGVYFGDGDQVMIEASGQVFTRQQWKPVWPKRK